MKSKTYFAADTSDGLISACELKLQEWGARGSGASFYSSVFNAYWRNTVAFYSPILNTADWSTSLGYGGSQGELVSMVVPKTKTLVQQLSTLTTKAKIHYECVTDVNAQRPIETARLGKGILNAKAVDLDFEGKQYRTVERMSVQGSYFASVTWRLDKGRMIEPEPMDPMGMEPMDGFEQEQPHPSGDVHVEFHDLHDIIYDWTVEDFENLSWVMIRRKVNRWDLAATYPELADQISSLPSAKMERSSIASLQFVDGGGSDDDVLVKEFYHRISPALPQGRMVRWCSDSVVLTPENTPLPYKELPVVPFMIQKLPNTSLGYPWMSDLLPAQEMSDTCYSAVATNNAAHAIQSVLAPDNGNISVEQIGGMNFIRYKRDQDGKDLKPEPLQLTKTAPETFQFIQLLDQTMTSMSSINSTLQGQPPANVTSGAMAATLSANALELLGNIQKTVVTGFESIANKILQTYAMLADETQIIEIVGEGNAAYVKEFVGQDLHEIKRVRAKMDNPLLSSTAGRMSLVESIMPIMQSGDQEMMAKVVSILNGAPTDTLFQTPFSENMAVQMEIDALLEGKDVLPMITDHQPSFIKAYKQLTYNPEVRANAELASHIYELMLARMQLWMQLPPQMKVLLFGPNAMQDMQFSAPPPGAQPQPPPGQPGQQPSEATAAPQGGPPGGAPAMPAQPAQPGVF